MTPKRGFRYETKGNGARGPPVRPPVRARRLRHWGRCGHQGQKDPSDGGRRAEDRGKAGAPGGKGRRGRDRRRRGYFAADLPRLFLQSGGGAGL